MFTQREVNPLSPLRFAYALLIDAYDVPVTAAQALSSPRLAASVAGRPATVTLSFDTVQGWLYSVEYCTDLAAKNWQPLPRYIWGTGAPIQVSSPLPDAARFYRVMEVN